jgi:hypothetical protein
MHASRKPVSPSVQEHKQLPVGTFKNSLRAWQAGYQLRRATQERMAKRVHGQAARADERIASLTEHADGRLP